MERIIEIVQEFFEEHIAPPYRVVSCESLREEGWQLHVEVFEEQEYSKRYAKDEIIGIYEVRMSKQKKVISFSRTGLRYRSGIQ